MPKWAWWVVAALVFVIWNFDSFGEYWFGGWWTTVRHKPLGAWHAIDLLPFIAAYLAIRPVSEAVASFRKPRSNGEAGVPNLNP